MKIKTLAESLIAELEAHDHLRDFHSEVSKEDWGDDVWGAAFQNNPTPLQFLIGTLMPWGLCEHSYSEIFSNISIPEKSLNA